MNPAFQPSNESAREALLNLTDYLSQPEEEIDCFLAALLIASAHYPQLDTTLYLEQRDSLVKSVRPFLKLAHSPEQEINTLNALLFDEVGFIGNSKDYNSPQNSFINEVMDRRTGIPITLSLLYLTLSEKLGLPIFPVGMPYHFIVKYETPRHEIFIDPFYGGTLLTEADCYYRMEQAAGHAIGYDITYLRTISKRTLLYRLVNNLKRIYLESRNWYAAELVLKQLLIILPESSTNLRELGKICLHESRLKESIEWFQRYLDAEPNAPDAPQVQDAILQARRQRLVRN